MQAPTLKPLLTPEHLKTLEVKAKLKLETQKEVKDNFDRVMKLSKASDIFKQSKMK